MNEAQLMEDDRCRQASTSGHRCRRRCHSVLIRSRQNCRMEKKQGLLSVTSWLGCCSAFRYRQQQAWRGLAAPPQHELLESGIVRSWGKFEIPQTFLPPSVDWGLFSYPRSLPRPQHLRSQKRGEFASGCIQGQSCTDVFN